MLVQRRHQTFSDTLKLQIITTTRYMYNIFYLNRSTSRTQYSSHVCRNVYILYTLKPSHLHQHTYTHEINSYSTTHTKTGHILKIYI